LEELAGKEIDWQAHFDRHIAGCWLPRAVDAVNGGFHQTYAEDWSSLPDTSRSLVYHARMIWLAASAGMTEIADKGCKELWEKFWDPNYGGFVWKTSLDGKITDPEKHMYGNAFAVFALAKAGKNWDADWAFQWMDLHAHDDVNGGYVETCWSDGEQNLTTDGKDALGTPYGLKSMNTHLHILEALIELYNQTGDDKVRTRLREVLALFHTKFVTSDGKLFYYVTQDYNQASDVDSYGHALETAFLMIEAAYYVDDHVDETWVLAKALVDRSISVGWDAVHGGVFNEGHFDQSAHDRQKIWWVQAESFNVLRLMALQYGEPYASLRDKQWAFIERFMIDEEHNGWRPTLKENGSPIPGTNKSDAWTEGYHQGRSVLLARP